MHPPLYITTVAFHSFDNDFYANKAEASTSKQRRLEGIQDCNIDSEI